MVYIYVLLLESNKYYVGKTINPDIRINSHLNMNGSIWTQKYKPILIHQIIPDCDDYDEDKYTRIYMDKHGINNVRGGSYVQIELEKSTIEELEKMKNGTNDNCFTCGEKGHFTKDCLKKKINNNKSDEIKSGNIEVTNEQACKCALSYFFPHKKSKCTLKNMTIFNKTTNEIKKETIAIDSNDEMKEELKKEIMAIESNDEMKEELKKETSKIKNKNIIIKENETYNCIYCDKKFDTSKGAKYHENMHCKNKKNDVKLSNVEEKIEYNCSYCDKKFDTSKGANYHENMYCKNKNFKSTNNNNVCYKCGRNGHYSNKCYATKHINGKNL